MRFAFDSNKDASNLAKHGLSLSDAPLVFNARNKLTLESPQGGEDRKGSCMPTGKTPAELGTDWKRVQREAAQDAPIAFDAQTEPYDPNDAEAVTAFWNAATIRRGRGRPAAAVKRPTLNMRVDADVLAAFKATGPGWQTRINAALKEWLRTHSAA